MKLSPLILIAVCLVSCRTLDKKIVQMSEAKPEAVKSLMSQAQPETVITPQNSFPVIVRNGLSKTNFTIVWPDDGVKTNNDWSFEVASNLIGPWKTGDFDNVDGSVFLRLHGAHFFRMKGAFANTQTQ